MRQPRALPLREQHLLLLRRALGLLGRCAACGAFDCPGRAAVPWAFCGRGYINAKAAIPRPKQCPTPTQRAGVAGPMGGAAAASFLHGIWFQVDSHSKYTGGGETMQPIVPGSA